MPRISLLLRQFLVFWLLLVAVAAVSAQGPAAETVRVANGYDKAAFNYRMELASEHETFRIYRLTFPSPIQSPVAQNNTVPAELYLPKAVKPGSAPRPAVICLHILGGGFELTQLQCTALATRGIPALWFKLPYYAERGLPGGTRAVAADPKLFAQALAQGVQDVRRAVDVLASRGEVAPGHIGIMGVSMGGILAAAAAEQEPRISRAVLLLAGGDVLSIIHHARETRPLSEMLRRLPPSNRAEVEKAIGQVDPLLNAAALRRRADQGRVLMMNAAEDEVVPRACTEKLAAALGIGDRVVWLEGLGHYTRHGGLAQGPEDGERVLRPGPARRPWVYGARRLAGSRCCHKLAPAESCPPAATGLVVCRRRAQGGPLPPGRSGNPRGLERRQADRWPRANRARRRGSIQRPPQAFHPEQVLILRGQWRRALDGIRQSALSGGEESGDDLDRPASPDESGIVERHGRGRRAYRRAGLGAGNPRPVAFGRSHVPRGQGASHPSHPAGFQRRASTTACRRRRAERLEAEIQGVRATVVFHAWQTEAIAQDGLFQPPHDLTIREVPAADLRQMWAAVLDFAYANIKPPPSLPVKNSLAIVARDQAGHGLLCESQGKRLLFVEGTPEQMGAAQGRLLREPIRRLIARVVYGMGAADSMNSGVWWFDRTAEIERRTGPHLPPRFVAECDAMALAAGLSTRDARSGNLFPERFHCSGVALRGKATADGRILHARVLDYMRDIGLQDYACVTVFMPAKRNAWISAGYAGFLGTVTAMNERGLAIGEMGGRGEGHWDGVPMSFLLRDIMERAATVDEALKILQDSPRTCEYYYVISDKSRAMVAVQCEPEKITVLRPGEQHPRLPHVPDDTVLVSGGHRAEVLGERIQKGYGRIDVRALMDIIKRPVAMDSNLHDAVMAPETLDIWIADAGRKSAACDEPYAHFNLRQLLDYFREKSGR